MSEITQGCGLFYWDRNSQCTHAVADSIEGPYEKQDTALPVWAHSCRAFRDRETGTWLLFHVGEGIPGNGGGMVNCIVAVAVGRQTLTPPQLPSDECGQDVGHQPL